MLIALRELCSHQLVCVEASSSTKMNSLAAAGPILKAIVLRDGRVFSLGRHRNAYGFRTVSADNASVLVPVCLCNVAVA